MAGCRRDGARQKKMETFNPDDIATVNNAAAMAEELVSNHYKMSASQWIKRRYDIRTLSDLDPGEIIDGPFAQIIRYEGHRRNRSLGSSAYDFYKICLQDHTILAALMENRRLQLFPFILYIVTHELIHIVRFTKFLQQFDAAPEDRLVEEKRVHAATHQVLAPVKTAGLAEVLEFYGEWRIPYDGLRQKQNIS
ncbi:MAG: hypothetical protein AMJ54_10400 [Deltaproteobacteria bacterium SG8_13]|nr:MAG: hypothetical protein AMJ54_10400 [Deltaproteobacteria bacterium SG8_13]